ncbi:MAG: YceH family protein, partial [Proteobacteria bacterium]|nr:YceH family protein [Pseudomonadota bacterium]
MPDALPFLSETEARILGALIEKEKTTPDVYPLTLNSLTTACNQKTSRDPVMNLSETGVLAALEELRGRTLVIETFGASGRVLRYAHNFGKVYQLPAAAVALLAVLMLRGPQTVSELRANCDRLQHFADASSVEGYLEELAARAQPLAILLPRQPGAREQRWAHLLCGEPAV